MTFDEWPLYEAICDVYRTVDNPRQEIWDHVERETLCRKILERFPLGSPWLSLSADQIMKAWSSFGKVNIEKGNPVKKGELIVAVGRIHGRKCFYADRDIGECTNNVSLDRLVPGARGGKYSVRNCVIACDFHNTHRRDTNIEDYLREADGHAE